MRGYIAAKTHKISKADRSNFFRVSGRNFIITCYQVPQLNEDSSATYLELIGTRMIWDALVRILHVGLKNSGVSIEHGNRLHASA